MPREIDERVGRVRTRSEDLMQVKGRLVSLAIDLSGTQALVRRLQEDIEDLIAERHDQAESPGGR